MSVHVIHTLILTRLTPTPMTHIHTDKLLPNRFICAHIHCAKVQVDICMQSHVSFTWFAKQFHFLHMKPLDTPTPSIAILHPSFSLKSGNRKSGKCQLQITKGYAPEILTSQLEPKAFEWQGRRGVFCVPQTLSSTNQIPHPVRQYSSPVCLRWRESGVSPVNV